jgi:regulator of replication initiation timing
MDKLNGLFSLIKNESEQLRQEVKLLREEVRVLRQDNAELRDFLLPKALDATADAETRIEKPASSTKRLEDPVKAFIQAAAAEANEPARAAAPVPQIARNGSLTCLLRAEVLDVN